MEHQLRVIVNVRAVQILILSNGSRCWYDIGLIHIQYQEVIGDMTKLNIIWVQYNTSLYWYEARHVEPTAALLCRWTRPSLGPPRPVFRWKGRAAALRRSVLVISHISHGDIGCRAFGDSRLEMVMSGQELLTRYKQCFFILLSNETPTDNEKVAWGWLCRTQLFLNITCQFECRAIVRC